MESNLREHRYLVQSMQRLLSNYKKMGKDKFSASSAGLRLQALQSSWEQCRRLHQELEALISAADQKTHPYFINDEHGSAEAYFWEAADFFNDIVERLRLATSAKTVTSGQTPTTSTPSSARMPHIEIPRFKGEYTKWHSFANYFTTLVIDNQALSDLHRMHYLKGALEGQAAAAIEEIPISETNFQTAWDALTDRFENNRVMVEEALRGFMSLPAMTLETVDELTRLRDRTRESLALLSSLRCDTSAWGPILLFITTQKLERGVLRQWELSLGERKDIPRYEELDRFLASRIRSLEAVDRANAKRIEALPSVDNPPVQKSVRAHVVSATDRCPACTSRHPLFRCRKFRQATTSRRREIVVSGSLCFNCLRSGHVAPDCPTAATCGFCGRRHHSLLHSEQAHATNTTQESGKVARAHHLRLPKALPQPDVNRGEVILATALVRASGSDGRAQIVRALLDQGSEATFVSESVVQTLRLRRQRVMIEVSGAAGARVGSCKGRVAVQLTSATWDSHPVHIAALILPRLTSYRKNHQIHISKWPHLRGLKLADPCLEPHRPIDIIIGADYLGALLLPGLRAGGPHAPIAQHTRFGWVISGPTGHRSDAVQAFHTRTEPALAAIELKALMERLWELDAVPEANPLTPREAQCEAHFSRTHSRRADGRYIVRLPTVESQPPELGESRPRAAALLRSLSRRLTKDAALEQEYRQFLKDYINLDHMERIPVGDHSAGRVFLPHHPVIKDGGAGGARRVRVVFNASSPTSNGRSLNDHLLVGPRLQSDITVVLLRWRMYRFALKADVEKMYRQIRVHHRDTDLQCILWEDSPDLPPTEFRLTTVTYGTASAPYLAQRVLRQLAVDEGISFPLARTIAERHFYVDDVLFGADSISAAREARDQLVALLQRGGFPLHKWAASHPALLNDGPSHQGDPPLDLPGDAEGDQQQVLGVRWHPGIDCFTYATATMDRPHYTKRSILSVAARLFDPLGWVSPVTVAARVLLRDLWLRKVDWDERLPGDLIPRWDQFCTQLSSLSRVSIPRWCGWRAAAERIEVHGFADASSSAYAAVIYARIPATDHQPAKVTLLASKAKIAPLKAQSIPRLELCAVVLLARLLHHFCKEVPFTGAQVYGWTDSSVALAWLRRHSSAWRVFVANRVALVHELVPQVTWRHVPTTENPADCASRGVMPVDLLQHSLWWRGPSWLPKSRAEWPSLLKGEDADAETEARVVTVHTLSTVPRPAPFDPLQTRVSSWPRLLRITAACIKFLQRIVRKHESRLHVIPRIAAPHGALIIWIRWLQEIALGPEVQALHQGDPIPTGSQLHKLCPFLDKDGLLRVGGRLANSFLPFEERCPIILPQHRLSDLVAVHAHLRALHGGPQLTLSVLRQRYWLLRARDTARRVVHRCITCTRYRGTTATQQMAHLPHARVTPARPFSRSGVDFAGPFQTRTAKGRGHKSQKSYVAVFVCLGTRAIHLELVSDYSASGFLAALQRFASRRGRPAEMWSDNGTNFVGAARELRNVIKEARADSSTQAFLADEEITWHFIPPLAPHFGGLWEAGVKSVKHHLRRVVGAHTLTFEEMSTLLCSIEACLNSRPICAAPTGPEDGPALTPGHFLIGAAPLRLPTKDHSSLKESLLTRWQLVSRMRDHFWRGWRSTYLNSLQERRRWTKAAPNLAVGDIVIVKEDNTPPCEWRLGRIVQIHPGSDARVRVASLRTARGVILRPIVRLVPLPKDDVTSPPEAIHGGRRGSFNANAPLHQGT